MHPYFGSDAVQQTHEEKQIGFTCMAWKSKLSRAHHMSVISQDSVSVVGTRSRSQTLLNKPAGNQAVTIGTNDMHLAISESKRVSI